MGTNLAPGAPPGLAPGQPPAPAGPLSTVELEWISVCGARASQLRASATSASALQAERAVIEWGAAAALDQAAFLWAAGNDEHATALMRAAEATLAWALIPAPWRSTP